jgi:hypothetical protein
MSCAEPDSTTRARPASAAPRRGQAHLVVELTEREVRSLVRASTLVADLLRPELFRDGGAHAESPLVTAYQALVASCERAGVDLGLGRSRPRDRSGPDPFGPGQA